MSRKTIDCKQLHEWLLGPHKHGASHLQPNSSSIPAAPPGLGPRDARTQAGPSAGDLDVGIKVARSVGTKKVRQVSRILFQRECRYDHCQRRRDIADMQPSCIYASRQVGSAKATPHHELAGASHQSGSPTATETAAAPLLQLYQGAPSCPLVDRSSECSNALYSDETVEGVNASIKTSPPRWIASSLGRRVSSVPRRGRPTSRETDLDRSARVSLAPAPWGARTTASGAGTNAPGPG